MNQNITFNNLYNHGLARVAVAVPVCRVADPAHNARATLDLAREADGNGASVVLFPELGLTGYTCDDLFHQHALLDAALVALGEVVRASAGLTAVLAVGLPLRHNHLLYNCAVLAHRGRILGVVPKSYLPNYAEFYEARQFSPADSAIVPEIALLGQTVPFGTEMLFAASDVPGLVLHTEICEDLWVPVPPSSYAALAGATVLLNLSASNIVIGKAAYRRQLVAQQSARCLAAYLYASAGAGESSTDLAWDGQSLICENGEQIAESGRFTDRAHVIYADIDIDRLSRERMRTTTFGDSARRHAANTSQFRRVPFELGVDRSVELGADRTVARYPYVPSRAEDRDERCEEVYNIQVQALVQRLSSSGIGKVVIGVSGGLDSTHALLVCAKAMDRLGLPRSNILAWTMPGFATSTRTLDQAHRLMDAVGCSAAEIDIRPSCLQMLRDIGHPYAGGDPVYDVTFENVQAGERTSHLFRLANLHRAIVIGTGDLSELALGWCTYGVGDHMSHYNVNASVPKTLIGHVVSWVAQTGQIGATGSAVLRDVLATEISPELVPGHADTAPAQSTEASIGPYELHDFFLFHVLRHGTARAKLVFLAELAWGERGAAGPERCYSRGEIKRHLRTFLHRFFESSQFKRSCVPNGPKVGSGGSLSPRGDWRAPSDASAAVWLTELHQVPE